MGNTNLRWLWVVVIFVLGKGYNWCCFGCLVQERIALLQLKAQFYPPSGSASLPSWVEEESSNCCEWERVECNSTTGRVSGLSLSYNYGRGLGDNWYLNVSLFLPFQDLKTLNLSGNLLHDWVENEGFERLSRLSNLQVLDLSGNSFNNSVLSSLSGLSSLKYLYLGWNMLEGATHFNSFRRLTGLSNLEVLDLSHNVLNDSIQSFLKLEDFISLKELDLSYNELKSFDPIKGLKGSSALINLEVLKLFGNYLNDNVFPSLIGFSRVRYLDLSNNRLNGSIDIKELYALSNLEELDVSENEIKSFINPEGIKRLEKLKVLHLDNVKFNTSNLMNSLTTLSSLKTLYLRGNDFKGAFTAQGFKNLSNLEDLFLGGSSLNNNFLQSIAVLSSLKALSLVNCSLKLTLPTQGWCELKNLQELDISGNQVQGILPPCLGNLTYLRVLDLSDNELNGSIASSPLSNLTSLEYLALSNNYFQVPISLKLFANHSKLKVVLCEDNILIAENELDIWVPKFQLRYFAFSNCSKDNFQVRLPGFLYYQYTLRFVDLSHNNLSGTFPDWLLENNTRLEGLRLSDNSLAGTFKMPFHPNPNLLAIDISNNKVGGRIPPNISSIFPNLRALYMSGNAFIDGNLDSRFHDMNALVVLDLSNNLLSGVIPEYFTTRCLSLHTIILSKNNFEQISTMAFNVTELQHLYLDGNNFIGKIPNSLSLMSLYTLDISHNHFSGELPRWIGNMTEIMEVVMSQNHFEGLIRDEFCQLSNLLVLDLSENNLFGSIPSCFNPPNILHVRLYKNELEGPMTHAFKNNSISSLMTLDLSENYFSGIIPTWIGNFSSLYILLLKANKFEGNIPSQLCHLSQLIIVDISQNNLSGSLPPCLGNTIPFEGIGMSFLPMIYIEYQHVEVLLQSYVKSTLLLQTRKNMRFFLSQKDFGLDGAKEEVEFTTKRRSYSYEGNILSFMSGIDFSCNQLTGEIPAEIGNLSNIRALNFSHNNLTGSIPTTFANLSQVESLDLSYNNLNGQIPTQLIEMTSLAVFSVAHNNLSGKTPDRKAQFATFEETSYEGNPLLCGLPLHNNCNQSGSSPPLMPIAPNRQSEEDGFIDMWIFYVSFISSYIIVLLGIFAILCINPYWRQAWFYFVQMCITTTYYFVVDNFPKLSKFRNM